MLTRRAFWAIPEPAPWPESTDEKFLRALLTQVVESGCIDQKRVYSTGCSMGAGQSMWMACNAADIIAATTTR